MEELSFIDNQLVFGHFRSEIFKKYGEKATSTDFAKMTNLKDDSWWTSSIRYIYLSKDKDYIYAGVSVIDKDGFETKSEPTNKTIGCRPMISYSSINSGASEDNVFEVKHYEYPQTVVDSSLSSILESSYSYGSNCLKPTLEMYRIPGDHIVREFEYNGERYVRMVGNLDNKGVTLSDGRIVQFRRPYWFKVEPITWLVDKENDIAISKNILFSGVQFDNKLIYDGNFNNTYIKDYLNNDFAKEIIPYKDREQVEVFHYSDEENNYELKVTKTKKKGAKN